MDALNSVISGLVCGICSTFGTSVFSFSFSDACTPIVVRFRAKATGRIVSYNPAYPSEKSITIFHFDGWDAAPVLRSWIEIINRYGGTHYTGHDNSMPFPQTALREMCRCLLSYCCVPEENRYKWNLECGFWESNEREQRHGMLPLSKDIGRLVIVLFMMSVLLGPKSSQRRARRSPSLIPIVRASLTNTPYLKL